MKLLYFVELFTVNKPTDEFYLEISYIFSYSRFTGFALTINAEFEITFFKCAFYSDRVFDRCPICQNILLFDRCTNLL